eukprot:12933913-Prorocentrum_lima.AAC.1
MVAHGCAVSPWHPLCEGDPVVIFGLQSADGLMLNRTQGAIVTYSEEKGAIPGAGNQLGRPSS